MILQIVQNNDSNICSKTTYDIDAVDAIEKDDDVAADDDRRNVLMMRKIFVLLSVTARLVLNRVKIGRFSPPLQLHAIGLRKNCWDLWSNYVHKPLV